MKTVFLCNNLLGILTNINKLLPKLRKSKETIFTHLYYLDEKHYMVRDRDNYYQNCILSTFIY